MNITYLFGAGASVGTIPAVNDFLKGAEELKHSLVLEGENFNNERLNNALDYIINELPNYASIDTLIRKLHIQNRSFGIDINAGLIAIIHYHQLLKKIDKRYDLFLGNLIELKDNEAFLPQNVNFISWNYDRLFEISLSSLINGDLNKARNYVNINNNFEINDLQNKNPFLIKLNGSAGAFIDYQSENSMNKVSPRDIIRDVIFNFEGAVNKKIPGALIQFAWDENPNTRLSRKKANEIMKTTNILVVIGYSFPTFNRIIDKRLLENHDKFERVILQNTKGNIDGVCDRMMALMPNLEQKRIKMITDEHEFHMPIEI